MRKKPGVLTHTAVQREIQHIGNAVRMVIWIDIGLNTCFFFKEGNLCPAMTSHKFTLCSLPQDLVGS